MPDFLGAGDILGAMITPAVLISASGTLVLSTSNRLGRVVDRIRQLTTAAEEMPDAAETDEAVEKRTLIAEQIGWLTKRLQLLQTAVIFLYGSIGLLVGSSLTIGISATAKGLLGWVPITLALIGATGLMIGSGILVREARMAVKGTLHELDHVRKVVARKTTVPLSRNDGTPEGESTDASQKRR
jgi:hypothetical protein